MTVSTYKGFPTGSLDKAGERFGLKAADLMSLFDELEASSPQTQDNEFGLPLERATTQETQKGRGGVLGYKAPRTATRSVTKTFATPATKGVGSAIPSFQNIINMVNQPDLRAERPKEERPKEEPKLQVPGLTPEQETIKGYYQQYLGRAPQTSEITDWQGTGKTLAEIQTGLKEHSTSTAGTQAIGQYYQEYLGRPAQASEVKDWQGTGKSLEAIKEGLLGYAQQQKAAGGSPSPAPAPAPAAPAAASESDRESAIKQGYQAYFGRTPAAQEVSDWLGTGKSASDITSGLKGHATNIYSGRY